MTSLLFLTQKKICRRQSIYEVVYLKNIIWKLPQKGRKYLVLVGAHHLRTKIIINDETLEQFTYLGCNISYQFSNDVEFKLAKFLQLTDTIKRTIFKKV
jgi:hypothetical protein